MILLSLSVAWLAGLGLAAAGHADLTLAGLPLGAGAVVGFVAGRRLDLAVLALAMALLLMAGAHRLQRALPPAQPGGVALLNGAGPVRLRGVVAAEPEDRGSTQRFTFLAEEAGVDDAWLPSRGRVLVTARTFPRYGYGDRLELTGRLNAPPSFESFDYREYLARRGIVSLAAFPEVKRVGSFGGSALMAAIIDVRRRLGDSLAGALPEPEAALGRGILLGQRGSIPAELTDDFNASGISHLIAISGSNVTLVAGLVLSLFSRLLGRRRAVLAAVVLVAGFVVLVGATPSVMRAGVMGVLMLGAILAGRPGSALTAVAFAAAVITALQPLALLDVAFQLSFAATLGLVLIAPGLGHLLAGGLTRVLPPAAATWCAESIAVTAAATVAVFPITIANFERVSLVAIPANLLAVPLFGLTIVTSFVAAITGLVSGTLAEFAGRLAEAPLWLMIEVGHAFASVPGASLGVRDFGSEAAVLAYGAIGLAAVALAHRPAAATSSPSAGIRVPPLLPATALICAVAAIVWVEALTGSNGRLQVTVLDVGQGDAILIETPSGRTVLVDGGPSGAALLNVLGAELPSAAQRFDLVVLTHPQENHVAGLVALSERFDVRSAAVSGSTSDLASYKAWLDELSRRSTTVRTLLDGQVADLGRGVRLEVLWPSTQRVRGSVDDLNANSVVLRLSYGKVSFLLTGDLAADGEEALISTRGDLHATVLKVGHHGSDGSTGDTFLAAVNPSLAVVSLGEANSYGHPSPTTLLRLAGVPLFRTDRNGSVRFETDGERLFVKPDRGQYQLVPVSAR